MSVQSKLKLKEQVDFIDMLMNRLKKDLNKGMSTFSSNDIYYGIPGHNRMQNDIVKIRRELNELSKMLNPYGDN